MVVTRRPVNLKSFVRWLVRVLTAGFLMYALVTHWHEVASLSLRESGLVYLTLAAVATFGAQVWVGVVWTWLLASVGYPQSARWGAVTNLRTQVAKYLPGNVWHFYRRVRACQDRQIPLGAAVLSIVLETVLIIVAACMWGSAAFPLSGWHLAPIVPLLVVIHPRWLNPVLAKLALGRLKVFEKLASGATSTTQASATPTVLHHYPLRPLLGELGFVALRAGGFLGCLLALYEPELAEVPAILGAFAVAWVAGMVVPGAPGGIGVFEATALGLLDGRLPAGAIFGAVAAYRLLSIAMEGLGGLVPERWGGSGSPPTR